MDTGRLLLNISAGGREEGHPAAAAADRFASPQLFLPEAVQVFAVEAGEPLFTVHHGSPVRAIALSPAGRQLATACAERLAVWSADGELVRTAALAGAPDALVLQADGSAWSLIDGALTVSRPD